jgi:GGDEF domain-containing protein
MMDYLAVWRLVEETLSNPEAEQHWSLALPQLIQNVTGLSHVFITELLPGNPRQYVITASYPEIPSLTASHSLDSGLAGWVHTKLLPLALPNLKTEGNISYIFYQGDPLRRSTSFFGWPLIFNQLLLGALILSGTKDQNLESQKQAFCATLSMRLAAHLHQERLVGRIVELSGLDTQTGLPHRSYFLERLERLTGLLSVQNKGFNLTVLGVSGLGRFAQDNGQEEAKSLLRAIAQQLLQYATDDWELGHISYGIFALAVPDSDRASLENSIKLLKRRLDEWPQTRSAGRGSFIFHESQVAFPQDGTKPESLLEAALTSLAQE